ncbi:MULTISPECIES: GntR family transcriptional regulator [unclassified Streptomyces]|uniref:GntR family transcriptional regulator n=1 Tax=unclassified Streptomyces TaxID=2593676 RepID=UPI000F7069BF|nr:MULTISPECIES: GntR family transcriptional regulator [unclassified Streptomyces]AZM59449.1 GntR family transcriptional regulator [Streptomyces sp. WAC 01438]RSM95690.1 GntR family transcriptional regulator [Streptomyces sp. WAC 01420]
MSRGVTAARRAADELRKAILSGEMVPGQRLVEVELAETYGVTRASLRQALLDLAAEGLVERIPNRGARVRVVPIEEAIAITECRMVLEGLCAAKAAERATDDDIARLRGLGDEMQAAVAAGEPLKYSQLNQAMHRLVLEMSGQKAAAELIDRLRAQLIRHQYKLALQPGRPAVSLPQHLAIIESIANRDPEAAEAAARRHVDSVISAMRKA